MSRSSCQSAFAAKALILSWICILGWVSNAKAQDEPNDDAPENTNTSVFSRLFGSSNSKKTASPAAKPKVPATPTAGRNNRSGLFVPLKSITRAFRGPTESESEEITEPQTPVAPRIPREPFRNIPRLSERDQALSDLQVLETPIGPASPYLGKPESIQRSPAPIVRAEPAPLSRPSASNKPRPTVTSQEAIEKKSQASSVERVIESSSTSRRPNMEGKEKDAIAAQSTSNSKASASSTGPRKRTPLTEDETLVSTTRRLDPPEDLIEIGESTPLPKTERQSSPSAKAKEFAKSANSAPELENSNRKPVPVPPPTPNLDLSPSRSMSTVPASSTGSISKPRSNEIAKPSIDSRSTQSNQMSLPGVRVVVNGPDAMLVNKDCVYEIEARNEGNEPLNGLAMRISAPHHVSLGQVSATAGATQPDNDQDGNAIVWEIDTIPAGSKHSVRLAMQTNRPEHFGLGVEWTVLPQTSETPIQVHQPQLALALEGPSEVEYGKAQMYRIRLRNPGTTEVKGVSVAMSAEPYGSNQSDIGDIAAGAERVIDVELTFQQTGRLPIRASAISSAFEVRADSAIEVQVHQAELGAKWQGPTEFYQGGVAEYELEIANTGTIAATNVACRVSIPADAEVVSLPVGSVRRGNNIQWEIRKLDPRDKTTVPLRLALHRLGDSKIEFVGECVTAGEVRASFATHVDSIADLHLSVTDPVAPAPVGQPVTYEVVITNRGKKAATNVEVVAQFSEGIEPIRVEGHSGNIVPGQVLFNAIGTIGPNEKKVLKVIAEAAKPGVHRFRAEVKCVGSDADLLEEESTRFLATGMRSDRR